jgi:hypothetical protein
VSTRHSAALIAHRQGVASTLAAAAQHSAPIFCTHTRQKAVFAAARNTFRLPGSFRHRKQLLCWRYHHILNRYFILVSVDRSFFFWFPIRKKINA